MRRVLSIIHIGLVSLFPQLVPCFGLIADHWIPLLPRLAFESPSQIAQTTSSHADFWCGEESGSRQTPCCRHARTSIRECDASQLCIDRESKITEPTPAPLVPPVHPPRLAPH